jgi:hypothetical protein
MIAAALAAAVGSRASYLGGVFRIAAADGSPLDVGPLKQQRAAFTLIAPTTNGLTISDSRVHYTTAVMTLSSSPTPVWSPG